MNIWIYWFSQTISRKRKILRHQLFSLNLHVRSNQWKWALIFWQVSGIYFVSIRSNVQWPWSYFCPTSSLLLAMQIHCMTVKPTQRVFFLSTFCKIFLACTPVINNNSLHCQKHVYDVGEDLCGCGPVRVQLGPTTALSSLALTCASAATNPWLLLSESMIFRFQI